MALLSGSSACSMRSFIFAPGLGAAVAACPASERNRAPSTEFGVTMAAPKANTTAATVMKMTIVRISSGICLHLNPDDLTDHEITDRLQRNAHHDQKVSDGVIKERTHELRAEQIKHQNHDRRHGHQQHHGESSLRSMYFYLTLNLEAFANHVGQIIQDLCQIASGFALQHDGGHKKFDIDERNALGEIHQSIAHGHAELLLFVELPEFTGQRLGDLI